ncbi:MAG: ATP-grasp domain-containing protein, partial [Pseudomonadota bacterium]|nr:ATP-grasp domain-containing protein [Pseudomonadota bacterium]
MNLHEYQSKSLFKEYGIGVPQGQLITQLDELDAAMDSVGGEAWVVKAQIHAGARGKAGGVKLVTTRDEARQVSSELLGSALATIQTAGKALPINSLLIEETLAIEEELYLSLVVDRVTRTYTFIISAAGGMDIEAVAEESPEKILSVNIDPTVGVMPYQCREVGFALGLTGTAFKQIGQLMKQFYQLALDK